MTGACILMLGQHQFGSFTWGGSQASVFYLANAASGPAFARLIDRFGQRLTARLMAVFFAASGSLEIALAALRSPLWATAGACLLMGITLPNAGALARARWESEVKSAGLMRTALAVEATCDELTFMLGPLIVIALNSCVGWHAGLSAICISTLSGTWMLTRQAVTRPTPAPPTSVPTKTVLRDRRTLALLASLFLLGCSFSASEIGFLARAQDLGSPSLTGVLLALWAAGSATSGILLGARSFRRGPPMRYAWASRYTAVCATPLVLADSPWALAAAALLAGTAAAPVLIFGFECACELTPQSQRHEGLSWVTGSLTLGSMAGAAVSGCVTDAAGPHAPFIVAAACAAATALAAQVMGLDP
ncbi:MFS transporter [Streptomyces sp. NPDC056661]|uniref:MFS transporter n=1 Tax=Streptomyces sp. NPDC056661 TaxID=3345898 RepID=UPI0036909A31